VRRLLSQIVSTHGARTSRPEPWALFGSFGDDCFDDEPPPPQGRVAFCRRH